MCMYRSLGPADMMRLDQIRGGLAVDAPGTKKRHGELYENLNNRNSEREINVWWKARGCKKRNLRRYGVIFTVNIFKNIQNAYRLQSDKLKEWTKRILFVSGAIQLMYSNIYHPGICTYFSGGRRNYQTFLTFCKWLSITVPEETAIILGDCNAKVVHEKVYGITESFGLGERNDAGERLVDFYSDNDLVIANTWFQQPRRCLNTWTSPDGQCHN